ncbi:major capsid protein [Dipodfec virus UOA04_Rod_499]|nr:major capsid protein [Dipodfec virus UOA04_Rod_499]
MAHYTGMKQLQNSVHKSGADISSKNLFTAKVGELLPVYWDIGIPNRSYDINIEYFTRTRPVQTSAYTRIREYFDFYAVPLDLLWKSFDNSVIQMGDKNPTQSKSLLEALTTNTDLPYTAINNLHFACLFQSHQLSGTGSSVTVPQGFGSMFGFNKGDLTHKLLHYLNYGNFVAKTTTVVGNSSNRYWNRQGIDDTGYSQKYDVNQSVNLLPLLAYQKIYQDFFRWSQWENASPTCYNVDWYNGSGDLFGSGGLTASIPSNSPYWSRENMFSLRYCNWNKDLFMGILPNSQFGDLATVEIPLTSVTFAQGSSSSGTLKNVQFGSNSANGYVQTAAQIAPSSPDASIKSSASASIPSNTYLITNLQGQSSISSATGNSFSILALRQAEALQKWKEISQSVDTNYRDQIRAHFGINVPQDDSHMCKYIGGIARNLDISEVINNNLDASDSQAYIYGKGVGSGSGSMRYNTGSRYCILMCIYHAVPLLDYDISGQDGQLLVTNTEDLPIPEFDNIGMEAVPSVQLFNSAAYPGSGISNHPILGYNPRYFNWKTKIDRIHGAFTTDLKDWVAPIDDSYLYSFFPTGGINSNFAWQFFKVNPNTLDSIFQIQVDSTWSTDQLLVNCNVDCRVVNPLSADGMPY